MKLSEVVVILFAIAILVGFVWAVDKRNERIICVMKHGYFSKLCEY